MFDEETYRTAMNVMDRDSRSGQHSIITPQPFMEHVPTPHFIDLSPSINHKLDRPDSRFNSTSSSDNYSSKENRRMKSGSYGDLIGVEHGDHRSFNPYLSSHNDNIDGNSSNVRKDWAEQIFNRNNYGDRYYGRPPFQQQQRHQHRPQQQFKNKPVSRSIDNIEQQTQQRYRSATQYRPPLYSPMSSDNEGRSSSDYFNRQCSGNSRTDYRTVSESENPNSFRRRYYEESVSSDDRSNVHPSRYTMKTQQQQFEQMNLSPRSMISGSESGDEILVVKRAGMVGNKFEMKPPIARQAIRSYGSHSRLDSNNNNIGMHSNNNNYDDNRNDTSADPDRIAREYWENRWTSGDYGNSSRNNNPRYSHRQQYNSSDNLLNNNFSSSSRERFFSTRTSSNNRDNNNSSNNVSNRTVLKNVSNNSNGSNNANNDSGVGKDKELLKKIQQELESQRMNWTGEIDKLLSPMSADLERTRSPFASYTNSSPSPSSPSLHPTFNAEKNSFIDTSGPMAIFKAFVDVSDYPTKSVSVRMDNWSNKVLAKS
ncbi:hypothetical protein HELRODRAFT_169672 [Helobdella robusta]|uniref:Uncharacterized protein n=1 Tax=Helobdella robusta TaxID=6412 RepID=T1F277_HELRO|nr:hypothetical protein HELRODRAFT_169672 [Helobdella robusta]ESO07958.1 hypothetical protein HELRODRAFT_169672 [Helobdella robusta]